MTFRAGIVGELPISTFLSAQLRTGISRTDVGDAVVPITFESSLGFAIY